MKIVFCHNVYNRFNTLKETISIEKSIFPDSQCILAYNAESPESMLVGFTDIEYVKFPGLTHKIGCANGCTASIKAALKYDPDIIVFSHDDVSINGTASIEDNPFLKNLISIVKKEYDVICRKPLPKELYGENYYMMETFVLSKKAAEVAFNELKYFDREENLPRDIRGSISPEVFLYEVLNGKGLNILEKGYDHKLEGYNKMLTDTMGYYHKNIGERGWTD